MSHLLSWWRFCRIGTQLLEPAGSECRGGHGATLCRILLMWGCPTSSYLLGDNCFFLLPQSIRVRVRGGASSQERRAVGRTVEIDRIFQFYLGGYGSHRFRYGWANVERALDWSPGSYLLFENFTMGGFDEVVANGVFGVAGGWEWRGWLSINQKPRSAAE